MTVPEGARVIASGSFCKIAGLAYDDEAGRPWAMSLQPHPEFDARYEADLIDAYSDGLPREAVEAAKASLVSLLDNDRVAAWMADFYLQP